MTSTVHVHSDVQANQQLLDDFATMSTFGATAAGGVERQAGTEADGETRRWLGDWLVKRGFTVHFDRIGNMFGVYELVPGAPYVLAGSHLDSQPRGGRFDGAYGVLAAAHAADRLRELFHKGGLAAQYNLAVVNWFNEEGSRFKPSMQGSGVFTGKIDLETALTTCDHQGVTSAKALDNLGMRGDTDTFTVGSHHTPDGLNVAAYAEIHIEQGRELEKSGVTMGIVDSTWAANKYEISIVGSQAHTGATAIVDRQDALYGAALVVVGLRELAHRYGERLHTSCGEFTVYPNSPVVVPRQVDLHLDLRSDDDALLAEADSALKRLYAEVGVKANVKVEHRFAHTWKGQTYTPAGVELTTSVIDDLGYSHMRVRTRAGHDSTNMKDVVPTVMLFIPSVDGISHAEAELTLDDDLIAGVDVLTETLARIVEGGL